MTHADTISNTQISMLDLEQLEDVTGGKDSHIVEGAGFGGLIGAEIGGPVGAAVGVVVGGLVGGIVDWFS